MASYALKNAVSALLIAFLAVGLCPIAVTQSESPSLGDYGRSLRKNNPSKTTPTKTYDNDSLPSTEVLNVVDNRPKFDGSADNTPASNSDMQNNTDQSKTDDPVEIKKGQSFAERQKVYAHWQKRINKQEDKVEQLALELNDLKQKPPFSVVVLHLWPDDQLYSQSIVQKQKALDQARDDLSALQDEGHKAGVPFSHLEAETKSRPSQSAEQRANVMSQQQALKAQLLSSSLDSSEESKEKTVDSDSSPKISLGKDQKDPGEIKVGQSPEERKKAYAEWQKRIERREEKVNQLTDQLDKLKQNLPEAVILHVWPEDKIYLQMVTDKQQAIDQAKADVAELQEQARKVGVPSSFTH